MLTAQEAPFTGVYGSTATKRDSHGPTVEALKRAVARLGYMEWKGTEFTRLWPAGGIFDKAFRRWQLDIDLPADGIYGQQAWKAMRYAKVKTGKFKGSPALDEYAQKLLRDEWQADNVPDEDDIRAAIADFCLVAEANEDAWHYRQARPIDISVDPGANYVWSDCSGYVIQAYYHAKTKTGLKIPDPSKQNWTGYGNTEYYENDHPRVLDGKFKAGDLAHYPGHVTICRRAGTPSTAIFSSHGQEAGPMPTTIHYRSDFQFVVRPPLK